jgi:hypothetical protein
VSLGGVIMRAVWHTATLNRERLAAMVVVDSQADPFDLDALVVSDRFRLLGFTRRDDYLAYLWVLRAIDRLRGAHVAQAHTDDVAEVLAEFAAAHDTVPGDLTSLRDRLDNLTDDGVLHRLEDASRAGSLARYRNRQSLPVQRAGTPRIRGGGGRARGAGAGREPVPACVFRHPARSGAAEAATLTIGLPYLSAGIRVGARLSRRTSSPQMRAVRGSADALGQ